MRVRIASGVPQNDMGKIMKPPIGIMPRKIWNEIRYTELRGAINRYFELGYPIPEEWVDEYNELILILSVED